MQEIQKVKTLNDDLIHRLKLTADKYGDEGDVIVKLSTYTIGEIQKRLIAADDFAAEVFSSNCQRNALREFDPKKYGADQ